MNSLKICLLGIFLNFSFFLNAQDSPLMIKKIISQSPKQLLISGHRGGFYEKIPENSLAAFEYTLEHACFLPIILELDVKMSHEGNLFVFHDDSLHRCSSGIGKIAESSDAYLEGLFLKNQDGVLTKEKIPTFESVLRFAKNKKIILMLDVKADIWEKVLELVKAEQMISQVLVLTFSEKDTRLTHQLCPDVLISVLLPNEKAWEKIEKIKIPYDHLIAYTTAKTPSKLIKTLQNHRIPLMRDVSEHQKGQNSPFESQFYQNFAKENKLDVLITDFPVEVSPTFCK